MRKLFVVDTKHEAEHHFICDYLHMTRLSKNLTLVSVASTIDYVPTSISQFEHGIRYFSLGLIYRLCDAYGLLVSTVFIFAETATSVGIDRAYELEAPQLIPAREKYLEQKALLCHRKSKLSSSTGSNQKTGSKRPSKTRSISAN